MDKQPGQQGRCHLHRENLSGAADIAGSRLRVNYTIHIKYIGIWYIYIYNYCTRRRDYVREYSYARVYIIVLYYYGGSINDFRGAYNISYLGSETRRRRILENRNTWSFPASWCSGRTRRTACTCIRSRL